MLEVARRKAGRDGRFEARAVTAEHVACEPGQFDTVVDTFGVRALCTQGLY